jgi:hypothetical protein
MHSGIRPDGSKIPWLSKFYPTVQCRGDSHAQNEIAGIANSGVDGGCHAELVANRPAIA